MDDADVRYIVQEACRNLRDEMQNEIDRLTNDLALLHCRVTELEKAP
jgi:hypothetical protein